MASASYKRLFQAQLMCKDIVLSSMVTVRSLAPICSSTTSTMFSGTCFKQTHTKKVNKEERLLCRISRYMLTVTWVTDITSLTCRARKTRVSGGQADIYAWSQLLGGYSIIFLIFCWITGCGSASLKLCVSNAASPWSPCPFPDSQCGVQWKGAAFLK